MNASARNGGTAARSSVRSRPGSGWLSAPFFDSNVTTLIAAVVLFGLGSGPVRGFAVTLAHRHPDHHLHRLHLHASHRRHLGAARRGPKTCRCDRGAHAWVQALTLHSGDAGIHFMRAARYGFVGSSILIVVAVIIYLLRRSQFRHRFQWRHPDRDQDARAGRSDDAARDARLARARQRRRAAGIRRADRRADPSADPDATRRRQQASVDKVRHGARPRHRLPPHRDRRPQGLGRARAAAASSPWWWRSFW